MNSFYHARSSANKWGGSWKDYHDIHAWFDQTKQSFAQMHHRAILHHAHGIYIAEQTFGEVIDVKGEYTTRQIPVRLIGERHMMEDLGFIPSLEDYLKCMTPKPWMAGAAKKNENAEPNRIIPLPTIAEVIERINQRDDSGQ